MNVPQVDNSISFNAFHILLIILISNIIINPSWNWESLLNAIYYVLEMETPGFWFLMMHVIIAYIMLTSLEFHINFRADIKFNL
jgi:hypothetical protein